MVSSTDPVYRGIYPLKILKIIPAFLLQLVGKIKSLWFCPDTGDSFHLFLHNLNFIDYYKILSLNLWIRKSIFLNAFLGTFFEWVSWAKIKCVFSGHRSSADGRARVRRWWRTRVRALRPATQCPHASAPSRAIRGAASRRCPKCRPPRTSATCATRSEQNEQIRHHNDKFWTPIPLV